MPLSIPTKPPDWRIQLSTKFCSSCSVPLHVRSTRDSDMAFLPYLMVFVCRTSILSRVLITSIHLFTISILVCRWSGSSFLLMSLSHLIFQIRCADSDIRIVYNRSYPRSRCFFPCLHGFCIFWRVKDGSAHPRIPPYVSCGQSEARRFHSFSASSQTTDRASDSGHSSKMCSILSSPPHRPHFARFVIFGITVHFSPMRYALCRFFHRNPLAPFEIMGFRIDFQMHASDGKDPLSPCTPCRVIARRMWVSRRSGVEIVFCIPQYSRAWV